MHLRFSFVFVLTASNESECLYKVFRWICVGNTNIFEQARWRRSSQCWLWIEMFEWCWVFDQSLVLLANRSLNWMNDWISPAIRIFCPRHKVINNQHIYWDKRIHSDPWRIMNTMTNGICYATVSMVSVCGFRKLLVLSFICIGVICLSLLGMLMKSEWLKEVPNKLSAK